MSSPLSHNLVSACDFTERLPPELKGKILTWGSRDGLLSASLVSRNWRSITTADPRFFLVIRISTNEYIARRDLPSIVVGLVETCFKHKLWIKLAVSLPFAPTRKWHDEDRIFAQWFCKILCQIMPRTVALHMELSGSIWPIIQKVLTTCPAPVLRALNLAWVEGDASPDSFSRPTILSGIFADQAPFLTSLRLDAFVPSATPVVALFNVCNLSITLGSDDNMQNKVLPSLDLGKVMPALRNLDSSLSPSRFNLYQTLDLRNLALASLSLSDDSCWSGSDAILKLGKHQQRAVPFVRRVRATVAFEPSEVIAYLEECNVSTKGRTALPLALSLTMDPPTETTGTSYYVELRALDGVGNTSRLRSFTVGLDPPMPQASIQPIFGCSLKYSAVQLVSLTVDNTYIPFLVDLGIGLFTRLVRLDLHVKLVDWLVWPSGPSQPWPDTTQTMETPALEVVRVSAIGGRWRISPEVVKKIGATFRHENNDSPLRLELSGILVANLPATFDPFEGFDKVIGSLAQVLPDCVDHLVLGREDCFMEQTFHDYNIGKEYLSQT